jgi:hypothetical protein
MVAANSAADELRTNPAELPPEQNAHNKFNALCAGSAHKHDSPYPAFLVSFTSSGSPGTTTRRDTIMAIKNLTTVAASTAALVTLAVAGMPQASASVPPELDMNATYHYHGIDGEDTWHVETTCSQSGECTQTIHSAIVHEAQAKLVGGKWTFTRHAADGFHCPLDNKDYGGTDTYTYDASGGTQVDVADPGVDCGTETSKPQTRLIKLNMQLGKAHRAS